MTQLTELLHERHHIRPDQENDFNLRDMTELTKTMAATSALMSALLLTVAAISLVVGGVGIMNIMLVSVTERTREIGLRMAVGARGYHILRQFLVEAVVLCLLGGALGIAVGTRRVDVGAQHHALAHRNLPAGHHRRRGRLGDRGRRLRILSRLEGLAARSHRSAALRVKAWFRVRVTAAVEVAGTLRVPRLFAALSRDFSTWTANHSA